MSQSLSRIDRLGRRPDCTIEVRYPLVLHHRLPRRPAKWARKAGALWLDDIGHLQEVRYLPCGEGHHGTVTLDPARVGRDAGRIVD